jgi:hypothetical protein
LGATVAIVHSANQVGGDVAGWSALNSVDLLCYTNADPEQVRQFPEDTRAIHVVRDPRDIVVSAYFSHRNSHGLAGFPQLREHRRRLREVGLGDGLLLEIEFRAGQFAQMEAWSYGRPNVLELKLEDLSRSPERQLEALQFLSVVGDTAARAAGPFTRGYNRAVTRAGNLYRELPRRYQVRVRHRPPDQGPYLSGSAWSRRLVRRALHLRPGEAQSIIERHRFERLTGGRPPGVEDVHHHYRKGIAGEWRSLFEERHRALFTRLYPNLVAALGYGSWDE